MLEEILGMKEQLRNAEDLIIQDEEIIVELRSSLDNTTRSLMAEAETKERELKEKIGTLEAENTRKDDDRRQTSQRVTKLENDFESVSKLNEQLRQVTGEQGQTIQDLRQREAYLQQELLDRREQLVKQEKSTEEKEDTISILNEEISGLRKNINRKDLSLQEIRQAEEKLSRKLVEQTGVVAKLEKIISSKNNEIQELNSQGERLHSALDEVKEKAEGYARTVKALKVKLQEMNEAFREGKSEVRKRDEKINLLRKKLEHLQGELKREQDKNQVRVMIQALIARREELNAQIGQLEQIQNGEMPPEIEKFAEQIACGNARVEVPVIVEEKVIETVVKQIPVATLVPETKELPVTGKKYPDLPKSALEPGADELNQMEEAFPAGTEVEMSGRLGKVLKDGLIEWADGGIGNLQALRDRLTPAKSMATS